MLRKLADNVSKMPPLEVMFRAVFVAVGLFVLSFAVWQAGVSIWTITTHQTARAEVVRCHADGSPSTRFKTYSLEVRWRTVEGGRQSSSIRRAQRSYEPGEELDVYYLPETAYRGTAGGFWNLWSIPLFITVIGGMLFLAGAWPIKDKKRQH